MQKEFDIVIIGSGLGGLVCANILAKEGMRVLVLEKNQQFGGSLQTFSRDKVIFDTGVHYIGGLLPGQNLHKYFHYFGILDGLNLRQMDVNGFDMVSFDGDPTDYPFAQGSENFVQQLSAFFPQERDAIQQYIDLMAQVCDCFPLYKVQSNDRPTYNESLMALKASDVIDGLTENPKLKAVFAGTNFLYDGLEGRTPFYVHALATNSYIESAWRCIQGGSQISKLLIREIRKMGGVVLKHKKIVGIYADENGKIDFVKTEDGSQYRGKNYISNLDPKKTLPLVKNFTFRKAYLKRIFEAEETISSFSLYITLKPKSFPYFNKNFYHFKSQNQVWTAVDYDPKDWPLSYMMSMGVNSNQDTFADSLSVLTYMKYEEVKKWQNTFNTVVEKDMRGADYEKFKEDKTELILKELEKKFPTIRQCIQSTYVATPLTYRDYIGNSTGSLYGFIKDANFPLRNYLAPRTKIKNLFLTGQSISMHGILGVTIGAVLTCSELIGHQNLLEKINHAYQNFNSNT